MEVSKDFEAVRKTHGMAIPIINSLQLSILIMDYAYQIISPVQISTDLVKMH